jgi:hypothetical protein
MSRSISLTAAAAAVLALPLGACGGSSAPSKTRFDTALQVPFDPGAGAPLVRTIGPDHLILNMALSDDYLFLTTQWDGIYRLPKYGGAVEPVATNPSAQFNALAANARDVFWVEVRFGPNDEPHQKLQRRAAAGGPISTMRSDDFAGVIAVDDTYIVLSGGRGPGGRDAISLADGTTVPVPVDLEWLAIEGGDTYETSFWLDGNALYSVGCDAIIPDAFCGLVRNDIATGVVERGPALPRLSPGGPVAAKLVGADETHIYLYDGPRIWRLRKTDFASEDVYTPPAGVSAYQPLVGDNALYFVRALYPPPTTTSTERTDAAVTLPRPEVQLVALSKDGASMRVISRHPALADYINQMAQDRQFLYLLLGATGGRLENGNQILIVAKDHTDG